MDYYDVYLEDGRWHALVDALCALDPNQLPMGRIDRSDYVEALANAWIWPASFLEDPANQESQE
jgi:hypothetical protein